MVDGTLRFLVAFAAGIWGSVTGNLAQLLIDRLLAVVGRLREAEEGKEKDQTDEGASNFVNGSPIVVNGDQADEMVLVGSHV